MEPTNANEHYSPGCIVNVGGTLSRFLSCPPLPPSRSYERRRRQCATALLPICCQGATQPGLAAAAARARRRRRKQSGPRSQAQASIHGRKQSWTREGRWRRAARHCFHGPWPLASSPLVWGWTKRTESCFSVASAGLGDRSYSACAAR